MSKESISPKLEKILDFLKKRTGGCSIGDVSVCLDLNRHSCRGYLRKLTELGYLERLPHKRYSIKR